MLPRHLPSGRSRDWDVKVENFSVRQPLCLVVRPFFDKDESFWYFYRLFPSVICFLCFDDHKRSTVTVKTTLLFRPRVTLRRNTWQPNLLSTCNITRTLLQLATSLHCFLICLSALSSTLPIRLSVPLSVSVRQYVRLFSCLLACLSFVFLLPCLSAFLLLACLVSACGQVAFFLFLFRTR